MDIKARIHEVNKNHDGTQLDVTVVYENATDQLGSHIFTIPASDIDRFTKNPELINEMIVNLGVEKYIDEPAKEAEKVNEIETKKNVFEDLIGQEIEVKKGGK